MDESIMPGEGRFLTLADVADVLNISAIEAFQLIRDGELPAIKVGSSGHWRIERELLESYIEAQYEQARRMNLWEQANIASIIDFPARNRPAR